MVANELPCYNGKQDWVTSSSSYRPPSVVTSTEFDDDDVFQAVARAMIFRHEIERLCERDAINATLLTSEDKRGFLESLDLRSSNMYANVGGENELEQSAMDEIVEMTRATFGDTLKLLWRESITGYDSQSSGMLSEEDVTADDEPEHRHRLKTPKNLLHSPIRSVLSETYVSDISIKPKSSGRQRRRFFPDISEQPRFRSRIRLDFKLSHGGEQVKSLQLDGFVVPSMTGYAPPSPIATTAQRARIVTV